MGFFDRNREQLANKGIDDARLPPGQYLTERFPVLHVGDVPTYAPGDWDLKIFGLVDKPFTVNLDELKSMPAVTLLTDIHCVTKWSKFDTTWKGVRVRDLFERAGMQSGAAYIMGHAEHGYTANLPLGDVLLDESLVVYEYEGEEIEPIHGGPVRLLVPHLYFGNHQSGCAVLSYAQQMRQGSGSKMVTTCTEIRF